MSVEAVEIRVERLPVGHVKAEDFRTTVRRLEVTDVAQVVVRNEWMSLDPYMRLGLSGQAGFVAPFQPGDVLNGPAVGVVEASQDPAFPVGAHVRSEMGWRSRFVARPADAALTHLADDDVPAEWHLGVLGLTGVTAWIGITHVLQPVLNETVFISGAAGAVGSIACQLARIRGARVLGSVGTPEKADWLVNEIGADAAYNYRTQDLDAFLREHAPDGVDCYFDNVGGEMLEVFLRNTRAGGRIGLCGAMSQYEGSDYRSGPKNFFAAIENGLRLEGFNAFRLSTERWAEAVSALREHVIGGRIMPCMSVVRGIESVPKAFAEMFADGHRGKLVVAI